MKYIKFFESKLLENRFLEETKEIIDLIWDVVEGYEDDGRFEDVQIGVLSITKSKSRILCCNCNSDGRFEFNESGLVLFEEGNPIEYSIDISTTFGDLSEMYKELISRLSSLYNIKYSKIYYLDYLSNNWKSINSETDVISMVDLVGFDRVFIHPRPFDIRFGIEK